MFKIKDYTIIYGLLYWLFVGLLSLIITVFGCSRIGNKPTARDYQLEITGDSVLIFDGDRKLAGMPFENSKLDSIILNDNQ